MARTELISQAADRVPSAIRADALHVTFRLAAGYHPTEIAAELGTKRRQVEQLRSAMADGLCEVFADAGYSWAETRTVLGVPTANFMERNSLWNGNGRASRIPRPEDA